MSFQGYQEEVNLQVGQEIPGAEEGGQMMQLVRVQLARIISSAESGTNPTCATDSEQPTNKIEAAASTAAAQQVQSPIKFDIPIFEGDSATSWLTGSRRVVYQARASDVDAELTAARGEGLSVRAEVFDGSNVDPVRLRNAHVA